MYMIAIHFFFIVGITIGFLMRLELIAPGRTIMVPKLTIHISLFTGDNDFLIHYSGLPAIFGNFFLPIQIRTRTLHFRLNLLS